MTKLTKSHLLFFLIISCVYALDNYKIMLKPEEKRCFTDDVFKDTLIKLDLKSTTYFVNVELTKPGSNQKLTFHNSQNFKQIINAEQDGTLELCILSKYNVNFFVDISYYTGLEAKDFGGLIKEKDIKPMHDKISSIEDGISRMKTSYSHAQFHLGKYNSIKEEIGGFVSYWFVVLIVVMLSVGFIEIYFIRNTIKKMKLK